MAGISRATSTLPSFPFAKHGCGMLRAARGFSEEESGNELQALHATGHTGELVELLGKDHFKWPARISGLNDDPSTLAIHNFLNTVLGRKETRVFSPCCTGSPSLPPRPR